ncbi:hypothetical protein EYF80_040126 [Liparis tanakae]|uniref:Uncharacterized protein n=1 Tax=Liparis tanakae TaxID=230148 RepID=A0A4Z2G7Y2_9TELE|nr:hypothetical protein EYF80_040126 [Liparis tanakae]
MPDEEWHRGTRREQECGYCALHSITLPSFLPSSPKQYFHEGSVITLTPPDYILSMCVALFKQPLREKDAAATAAAAAGLPPFVRGVHRGGFWPLAAPGFASQRAPPV